MSLEVQTSDLPGSPEVRVVALTGALIRSTAGELDRVVRRLLKGPCRWLLFDLGHFLYLDSTGLGLLVSWARELRRSEGGVLLFDAPEKVRNLVEIMGLDAYLGVHPDRAAALAALPGATRPPEVLPSTPAVGPGGRAPDSATGVHPLLKLFQPGAAIRVAETEAPIEVVELGRLRLPSGRVVACDPLQAGGPACPYRLAVPPGRYPVAAAVASVEGDRRIACVQLRLADGIPRQWELAHRRTATGSGRLRTHLEQAFRVESCIGCLVDEECFSGLLKEGLKDAVIEELEHHSQHTWSWGVLPVRGEREGNLIAFTTGWGIGRYPGWCGTSSTGQPLCLMLDFQLEQV